MYSASERGVVNSKTGVGIDGRGRAEAGRGTVYSLIFSVGFRFHWTSDKDRHRALVSGHWHILDR